MIDSAGTSESPSRDSFPSLTRLDGAVLAAVALVGALNLAFPFSGDQAFFAVGAREMSRGAVLYRDFWDLKQPGIFVFYLFGGRLFGFTEVGIHLFELLVMLAFAATLILALKPAFSSAVIASLVPLFTVGTYYAVSFNPHLTQVEAIAGMPVFLAMALAGDPFRSRPWGTPAAFYGSGLAGGLALLLKFMFLPILLAFWATAFAFAVFVRREPPMRMALRAGLPGIGGILTPLVLVAAFFARADTLPILIQTFFVYPPRIFAEAPTGGSSRLLGGMLWFAKGFLPLAILAVPGIWPAIRRKPDYLRVCLLLWGLVGSGVILIQRQSRWEYHYLLLFVPLGILAALGLDELVSRGREKPFWNSPRGRFIAVVSTVLLCSPILYKVAKKSVLLVRYGGLLSEENRFAYRCELNGGYRAIREEAMVLSAPGSLSGSIWVCGDPSIYFLSDRDQAIALNGWALEFYLPEQWPQLNRQLEAAKPPYVFVDHLYRDLIRDKSPATLGLIEANYRTLRSSEAGTWYARP